MATKTRKIDRRTRYTRRVIKDTLLELLKKEPFNKLNVSQLCRQAEITRATFYLHYEDIYAVVDELLDEALEITEKNGSAANLPSLLALQTPQELAAQYNLLPVCQRVSDEPKYRPLFLDEVLSSHILTYIFQREKKQMVPALQELYHLDEKLAEDLYLFFVSGAFAVNQKNHWQKNADWFRFQTKLVDLLRKI